jgi:hypothetical protein
MAMFVPRGVYRPTTISGACQTPITPLAVPSQCHRDPLPPEMWWDLIHVRRWPGERPDLRKGLGSSYGLSPATQSEIFALSAENSKIMRTLAGFLLFKGTGEAQIRASAPDLCPILSVESRAGALSANLRSYCNCPWSWNLTGSGASAPIP